MAKPTIVTRAGKGSALTWTEGDANLTNLQDATVTIVAGTGGTSVVSDLNGSVTLVAGTNVTLTGDNTAKTVTINATGGGGDLVDDTTPQLGGALDVNGFAITSTSNANVEIAPNGTGDVLLTADTVRVGDAGAAATITTNGTSSLTINTNSGTNAGTIVMTNGTNGNIIITPNGTGVTNMVGVTVASHTPASAGTNPLFGRSSVTIGNSIRYGSFSLQKHRTDITLASMTNEPAVQVYSVRDSSNTNRIFASHRAVYQGTGANPYFAFDVSVNGFTDTIDVLTLGAGQARFGNASNNYTITTNGTGDLTLSTNEGTNSGTITIADGTNGNISITPNGTGKLLTSAIDGGSNDLVLTGGDIIVGQGSINITDTAITIAPESINGYCEITSDVLYLGDGGATTTVTTAGAQDLILNTEDNKIGSGKISIGAGANADIRIEPAGTGDINLSADTVFVGDGATNDATITTNGAGDLILNTNGGTNSGSIIIADGTNGNITLEPNGTGDVLLNADTVRVGDAAAAATITSNGAGNLTLNTNSGTNSGSIQITQGANANIIIATNGTGSTVFNSQAIAVRTNNTVGSIIGRAITTTSSAYNYPSVSIQKHRTDILTAAMTSEPAVIGFSVRDSANVNTNFGRLSCTYQGTSTNPFYRFSMSPDGFTTTFDCVSFGAARAIWGNGTTNYTHSTIGTGSLILDTNQGTDTGNITIASGVNGNISITPNGTGAVDFGATRPGSKIQYRRTFGCFHKTATVTAAAADTVYEFNWTSDVTAHVNTQGVTVSDTSRLNIDAAGDYMVTLEFQAKNTDNADRLVWIWLAKNGTNLSETAIQVKLQKENEQVITKQWLVEGVTAAQYLEVRFAVDDPSGISLQTVASQASPFVRPAVPSATITITPVGA
jgi:hypothetical protein